MFLAIVGGAVLIGSLAYLIQVITSKVQVPDIMMDIVTQPLDSTQFKPTDPVNFEKVQAAFDTAQTQEELLQVLSKEYAG
jgi:hypothetical protein